MFLVFFPPKHQHTKACCQNPTPPQNAFGFLSLSYDVWPKKTGTSINRNLATHSHSPPACATVISAADRTPVLYLSGMNRIHPFLWHRRFPRCSATSAGLFPRADPYLPLQPTAKTKVNVHQARSGWRWIVRGVYKCFCFRAIHHL